MSSNRVFFFYCQLTIILKVPLYSSNSSTPPSWSTSILLSVLLYLTQVTDPIYQYKLLQVNLSDLVFNFNYIRVKYNRVVLMFIFIEQSIIYFSYLLSYQRIFDCKMFIQAFFLQIYCNKLLWVVIFSKVRPLTSMYFHTLRKLSPY